MGMTWQVDACLIFLAASLHQPGAAQPCPECRVLCWCFEGSNFRDILFFISRGLVVHALKDTVCSWLRGSSGWQVPTHISINFLK